MNKLLYFYKEHKEELKTKTVKNKKDLKFKVIDVFHKLDTYGHTTNINWFLSLDKHRLIK